MTFFSSLTLTLIYVRKNIDWIIAAGEFRTVKKRSLENENNIISRKFLQIGGLYLYRSFIEEESQQIRLAGKPGDKPIERYSDDCVAKRFTHIGRIIGIFQNRAGMLRSLLAD